MFYIGVFQGPEGGGRQELDSMHSAPDNNINNTTQNLFEEREWDVAPRYNVCS